MPAASTLRTGNTEGLARTPPPTPAFAARRRWESWRVSFGTKLFLSGFFAILLPLVLGAVVVQLQVSRSLERLASDRSLQIARDVSRTLEMSLHEDLALASVIAADPSVVGSLERGDLREAEEVLRAIYDRSGSGYGTFLLVDRRGRVLVDVTGHPTDVDLSDRDYFVRARDGQASIAGPLVSRVSGRSIVGFCSPVRSARGEFVGAVVVWQDVDAFVERLSAIRIGRTGSVLISDGTGRILMQPGLTSGAAANLHDDPGLEPLVSTLGQRETGASLFTWRGVRKVGGFAAVPPTDLVVIFTQDRGEILEPARTVLAWLSAIVGVIFLLGVGLVVISSARLSTPVSRMMETLKQITAHSTDLIVGIGPDRRIIHANPAAQAFFDKDEAELIGTPVSLDAGLEDGDRRIWETLDRGTIWSGRLVSVPGGKAVSAMIVPIRSAKGEVTSYLEIAKDITEELLQEKRILQAQKLEAIGTLAGGIAHDFNNILMGLLGYAELSLESASDPRQTREYLGEIVTAIRRAKELVGQILTFGRAAEVSEPRQIHPKAVITEAYKLLRASTPAHIDIRLRLESDAAVVADPTRLHQVVVNLCTNAAHAIGMSPGVIRLELDDMQVDEDTARAHPGLHRGRHVVLRVSDSGCGMPPEVVEHIFEPFFTTKKPGEGTGLGLSVVHGIVRDMGGAISVYSEPGKGSTFNLIFPSATDRAAEEGDEESPLPAGTERILLIDDEKAIVAAFTTILSRLGYSIAAFSDSREALRALRNQPDGFDLVVTDQSMPGVTGLEIAREVRRLAPRIPILLTSGNLKDTLEEKARECGIDGLLRKPLDSRQLSRAIRTTLDQARAPGR